MFLVSDMFPSLPYFSLLVGGCHGRTRWKHWHIAHFIHHVTYALLPFHTDVQAETKEEEEEEEEIY
jgi:hypothetical protein